MRVFVERLFLVCIRVCGSLQEIGNLEIYIDETGAINYFLSRGYFKSKNCLREARAAIDKDKPAMCTLEPDPEKGGGPLQKMKNEVLDNTRLHDAVFDAKRLVTAWYRIAEFQLISLKQIAEFTLLQTPAYSQLEHLPLFVPGELLQAPLEFSNSHAGLYVSTNNPGARALAAELEAAYPSVKVATSIRDVGYFLLYLNEDTYSGSAGTQLAGEVRAAVRAASPHEEEAPSQTSRGSRARTLRDARASCTVQSRVPRKKRTANPGIQIVIVHENDPVRGGCAFSHFFESTPADLIQDGLYATLALAAYPGKSHRSVSMALLAKALGAAPKSSRDRAFDLMQASARAVQTAVTPEESLAQRAVRRVRRVSLASTRPVDLMEVSAC